MQIKPYFFSVVMPVYNSAPYLKEAIDSLVFQSIGFQKFIQLILVDDGSIDNSLEICNLYKQQYPDNVVVVSKSNGGVGSARNEGMKYATGKYVNFLDSDDKWDPNAFSTIHNYISDNPNTSILVTPIVFFGRKSEEHSLNYRFSSKRTIDIFKEWDSPHFSFSDAFIKAELLETLQFSDAKIGEDALAFTELLLDTQKYSVVPDATYYYRRRIDQSSATDLAKSNYSWWFNDPIQIHKKIFELSIRKFGKIIPYVQYAVMCLLQDRFKMKDRGELTDYEKNQYKELIFNFLPSINDEIILCQKRLSRPLKLFILSSKYNLSFAEAQSFLKISNDEVIWTFNGQKIPAWKLVYERTVHIDFIENNNGCCNIIGYIDSLIPANRIKFQSVNNKKELKQIALSPNFECALDSYFKSEYSFRLGFNISIPYETIHFIITLDGIEYKTKIVAEKFCPLNFNNKFGRRFYTLLNHYVLTSPQENCIKIQKCSKLWTLKREFLLEASMKKNHVSASLLNLRRFTFLRKVLLPKKNNIWIISDRIMEAGDNGEALFQYLAKEAPMNTKFHFAISPDSPDFLRMKSIGSVVPYGSNRFKRLMNIADYSISSLAEGNAIPRFSKEEAEILRGLPCPKFVFLQHGVIVNDVSSYAKHRKKNISLMITSSSKEKSSIVNNPRYGLSNEKICLLGLPRFDKLLDSKIKPRKTVLIAPTYRRHLRHAINIETGKRPEYVGFEKSEYFNFFQSLITNKNLISAARLYGFEIRFMLHPCHKQEAYKFASDYSLIITNQNYTEEFLSSSILVTDYSSVAFDYSLLRKPIIYTQFDKSNFIKDHSFSGETYFDFEQDGFGPVCTNLESTVTTIIHYMNSPTMEDIYQKRVDNFFDFPKKNICRNLVNLLTSSNK